jgi:hypothetical protein
MHSPFPRSGGARWLCCFLLTVWVGFAQYSSNVQGTVTDPNDAAIPQASVTLKNVDTGVQYRASTDAAGFYRFTSVAPGPYQLTIESAGFAKEAVERQVTTGETAAVNVQLRLGVTSSTVTVEAKVQGVNPDETRLQLTLSNSELQKLPLQGRGTLNMLKTIPGVNGTFENSDNIPIGQNAPEISANGRSSSSNVFAIDGTGVNSTQSTQALVITPNPDMLAEVAVQVASFSAESGAGSSLQVEFTTKSGTNQYHGDVDYSFTNNDLSARSFFQSSLQPFHRKHLSGALGGPIIKNRTFFFGSFLNEDRTTSSSGTGTYESDQFIDWAKAAYPNSQTVSMMSRFRPARVETSGVARDASSVFGSSCNTAATNFIPCDLPVIMNGSLVQVPGVRGTQYNLRLDHYFREAKDRIYAEYFRVDQTSDYLDARPNFDTLTPSTSYYSALNYSHVFSPSLLNQASLGMTRIYAATGVGGTMEYALLPSGGITVCCANGYFNYYSPSFPSANREHTQTVRDSVTWMKARHNMKFGFQYARRDYWQDRAGTYSRPYGYRYASWADVFSDSPNQMSLYTISGIDGKWQGQYYGAQQKTFAGYFHDEWKARPNLLLSFGLRWEDFGNPYKYGDHALNYSNGYLGSGSTLTEQISNVYVKITSHPFAGSMWKNFSPRFGAAWQPSFDKKLSVRAGFGFYQDALSLSDVTASLPTNTPNRITLNLSTYATNLPAPYVAFGTTTAGAPWGYPYPDITISGYNERGGVIGLSASANTMSDVLTPQKTAIWNLGLEREMFHQIILGATYSASHSWDQFFVQDMNVFTGDLLDGKQNRLTSYFGSIKYFRNELESNYHAAILTARQRLGNLQWQASYTYSRALADGQVVPDPFNPKENYGLSSIDIPHRFTASAVYTIPKFSSRLLKYAVSDWQAGIIFVGQSGTPFTVTSAASWCGSGTAAQLADVTACGDFNADGVTGDVPSFVSTSQRSGWDKQTLLRGALSISDFATPANYHTTPGEGTQSKNMFRNPNYMTLDVSLAKAVVLPWFRDQQSKFTFRAESFNALNRTNFGAIGSTISDTSTFGKVTSSNNGRILQLGIRFEF